MNQRALLFLILFWSTTLGSNVHGADDIVVGTALIVGNGPERHVIANLAKKFEEKHAFSSIDTFWHPNAKPLHTIQEKEADMAVTGLVAKEFPSTIIAWDGIAVVTNFANPVAELTTEQLRGIFSGTIRFWSDVWEEAPQLKIRLINRAFNQNIRQSFEQQLGIRRKPASTTILGPEVQVFKAVNGDVRAITYVSMRPALQAQSDGYGVTLQFINKIEPERQTVLDSTYPLRRPIVLVTQAQPSPITKVFIQFVLSPEGQRVIKAGQYYPLEY
ncbi:MAG: hypothetical protein GKS05_10535 [Nitrospirales bacterium]|nr:hypothetical protein [Nitrospirales bacterium]